MAQAPTAHKTENVIVVTIDGMRWQEVFRGADPDLIKTLGPDTLDAAKERTASAEEHYRCPTPNERRQAQMPFLWSVVTTQGQIFDAFFTTKPPGSGMGLAISESIIEAHGGRIWSTVKEGRGATFHFTLPAAPAEANPSVDAA
jgi:hypothetical protein